MMYHKVFKEIFFKLSPEVSHNISEYGLRILPYCPFSSRYYLSKVIKNPILSQSILGINFNNPVGLGAGFDKNGTMIKAISLLGFGFTEIGTITREKQKGNIRPRLFRFEEEESIQNSMGFNNNGVYHIMPNIKKLYPYNIPIGVNIGKSKSTELEYAVEDYKELIKISHQYCDYIVINISSPNTKKLRDLENESFIKKIFTIAKKITTKPILLKISPDMIAENAIRLSLVAVEHGANGIIANNTTQDYSILKNSKNFGGISGEAMREKSYKFFKDIAIELYNKTILISVGGVNSGEEAYKRIKAGASLVQLYSGLIFKGPSLVNNINKTLIELLNNDNLQNISEAIGLDYMNRFNDK